MWKQGIGYVLAMIATMVMILVYFLGMPVAFFLLESPSPELISWLFRLGTVLPLGWGIMSLLMVAYALFHQSTSQEDRTIGAAWQIANLIPTGLYLALAFWAWGVPSLGGGLVVAAGTAVLLFSPALAITLFALFAIAVLLPYCLGTYRGAQWHSYWLHEKARWYQELLDVLEFPTAAVYAAQLSTLLGNLKAEIDSEAGKESQDRPRNAKHVIWLETLGAQIQLIGETLSRQPTDAAREQNAAAWAAAFRRRQKEATKQADQTKTARPFIWATGGTAVWLIVSGLLGELAKWGWLLVQGSLPHP
jgi:hypothetical protein